MKHEISIILNFPNLKLNKILFVFFWAQEICVTKLGSERRIANLAFKKNLLHFFSQSSQCWPVLNQHNPKMVWINDVCDRDFKKSTLWDCYF